MLLLLLHVQKLHAYALFRLQLYFIRNASLKKQQSGNPKWFVFQKPCVCVLSARSCEQTFINHCLSRFGTTHSSHCRIAYVLFALIWLLICTLFSHRCSPFLIHCRCATFIIFHSFNSSSSSSSSSPYPTATWERACALLFSRNCANKATIAAWRNNTIAKRMVKFFRYHHISMLVVWVSEWASDMRYVIFYFDSLVVCVSYIIYGGLVSSYGNWQTWFMPLIMLCLWQMVPEYFGRERINLPSLADDYLTHVNMIFFSF